MPAPPRSSSRHSTFTDSARYGADQQPPSPSHSGRASHSGRVSTASPRSPSGRQDVRRPTLEIANRRDVRRMTADRQDGARQSQAGPSPRMQSPRLSGRRDRFASSGSDDEMSLERASSDFLDEAMAREENRKRQSFFSFGDKKREKDDDELSSLPSEDSGDGKKDKGPRKSLVAEAAVHGCSKTYACLKLTRRICTYLAWILFDFLTCDLRRRRRIRKFNSWINLGDRESRLAITRAKKKEFVEKANEELRSRGYRAWRLSLISSMHWLSRSYADMKLILLELFGRVDKKTGLPASVLEQWKLVKLVHSGHHGFVYEAVGQTKRHRERTAIIKLRDKSLGQVFNMPYQRSMKVLKSHIMVRDRNCFLRFLARLRILSADFHNVCLAETYAVFDSSEFFVEVMEQFKYGSVFDYLEHTGQQLDEHAACAVFKRIVKGLEYLHHHRIIHRDVRLSQVLIPKAIKKNGLGEVRLADLWCMARLPRRSPLVEKDLPLFTAIHSPEVVTQGIWTDKADMWSLGVMLFELLYGHLPFGGHGKALVQRICTQPPEYDVLATQPSDLSLDLFKGLFKRDYHRRFSARNALHHDWVRDFSEKRPEMQALCEARRIRRVKIIGKPAFRRGMPAENLLAAKTGMFNAGWCSYMGSTSCALDFELGAGDKRYWVTQMTASLWASDDNPKEIIVLATSRADLTYSEVHKHRVESSSDLAATIEVDKPIQYTRIRFFRNFGGSYGIALRKLTFYGYEVRAVKIQVDFDAVVLTNSAALWMHNESIADVSKVHKSLKDYLERGDAIPGSGQRYRKYRDIHSGMTHTTTMMGCFMPPVPPGLTIIAASLNLQYVSWVMVNQTPPRLKIMIETEFGERTKLFQTSDLPPSQHEPDSIVTFGYECLPILYSDPLNIPTELSLQIEVHFENNAGFLHLPQDFGLTFYYLPQASTPSDSEEEEAEKDRLTAGKKDGKKTRKSTAKKGDLQDAIEAVDDQSARHSGRVSVARIAKLRNSIASVGGMDGMDLEDQGSDYEAYEEEAHLRDDFANLEKTATYGPMGASAFDREELPSWQPMDMPVDEEGLAQDKTDKNWMDVEAGRSSDDYSSGTVQPCGTSQTTADTVPNASRISSKTGAKDNEGADSPNGSDDEEAQKDKEDDEADLQELRIKTAFACDEARVRIQSEIAARASVRALRAQARYDNARGRRTAASSYFSTFAERDGARCFESLRASPLGQHCQPACQVLEGCSGKEVPKAFQACMPIHALRKPGIVDAESLESGFIPEQRGESEQLESEQLEVGEKPSPNSKDGCTLQ